MISASQLAGILILFSSNWPRRFAVHVILVFCVANAVISNCSGFRVPFISCHSPPPLPPPGVLPLSSQSQESGPEQINNRRRSFIPSELLNESCVPSSSTDRTLRTCPAFGKQWRGVLCDESIDLLFKPIRKDRSLGRSQRRDNDRLFTTASNGEISIVD